MFRNIKAELVAPGRFELAESSIDQVDADRILVRNHCCGICQGTEIWPWRGRDCDTGQAVDYPLLLGHQNAGEVVAVGANVTGVSVGQRCAGLGVGGYQTYSLCDAAQCTLIPDGVSYEEATQALELASIVKEVDAAALRIEDKVAIIGAGPMGNLLMQVVKLRCPQLMIISDLDETRLQYAGPMGADHAIDASREDQVQRVTELTDGGATVVFEATCSVECLKLAIQMLRQEGKLVVFGTHPEPIDIRADVFKRKSCTAYFTFPIGPAEWVFYARRGMDLLRTGAVKITPLVTHRFKLDQMNEAFALIDSGAPEVMKIMVTP
ncbi:MAG: zinc-binding dehydrogenase [Lentisphaeria bacterium]|jgi:2-desacetyl-2-hydroxyethyl bacteriochlorophyllide A dehydrogenase|nr:zinc-binding dehydrogenase [Lentisphaeria bacterium]